MLAWHLSCEAQPLAERGADQVRSIPRKFAVDERRSNTRVETLAEKRRPSALREDAFAGDVGAAIRIDQHQVGRVAFAQEAAFGDVETLRGRVADLLHEMRQAEVSITHLLQ